MTICRLAFLLILGSGIGFSQVPDQPFEQWYSIRYYGAVRKDGKVFKDRNNLIQGISGGQLFLPAHGRFLHPGALVPDTRYRSMKSRTLRDMGVYQHQFWYLDEKSLWSHAWAGRMELLHHMPQAKMFAGGPDFSFLISDSTSLKYLKDSLVLWHTTLTGEQVKAISYARQKFWVLTSTHLYTLQNKKLQTFYSGEGFTSLAVNDTSVYLGYEKGYYHWKKESDLPLKHTQLPSVPVNTVALINGHPWMGTNKGVFTPKPDATYAYFQGERWLPGDEVISITAGPTNSVLVLTTQGLSQLSKRMITLQEKAYFFENQVRTRHIRNGFNASLEGMEKGNLGTGYLSDADNDGLWTSMYLGSQAFRYAATKEKQALENCRESLEAMERLYAVTSIPGFPARSFERKSIKSQLSDTNVWQPSHQPGWVWKATTSSDEAIGHVFAFATVAELVNEPSLQKKAIRLLDTLMNHIVSHDLYLMDYDGKPTKWGRWNPAYVNSFPVNVGDRKLNSSNIIGMLQTAYHFTKKEKYRKKAFELMTKHGYLANLTRPMSEIGKAPDNADEHSKLLSEGWNHSDDEMYFLGYWGLYRYAFNDTLRAQYRQAIIDHWQVERPEKDATWNFFTALTGTKSFDLAESIWYLQQYPLDLIDWRIQNSHRQDLHFLPDNFRKQTISQVLSPAERPMQRHNRNTFILDENGNGQSEFSAGDTWLLPYWLGRYLGIIKASPSDHSLLFSN
ncbi:hypothetical protein [Siphonobacter sp. SORGH_AS_0500]|uniref:hypothetical protein n=1 Tax=Siphonobacter sp. SORGH_AS_0500 TaxID=1864824 RepID=UPI00285BEB99|nr:hypothetical protein [Siphonobacter sp. SORGH_AS_0500]MDR6197670.1 hypothetical protein [Siphonobacter sp. SORGH_AS_0500]